MISIIVPVYQAEKTIKRCIESVLCQTYRNLELILIDDGSTDMSGKICDEYAKKDNRIIVVHIENSEVSNARNVGLKKASGKYIEFLDSDDSLDKNACEILVNSIVESGAELVICGHKIYKNGKYVSSVGINRKYNTKEELIKDFEYLYNEMYFNPPWNKIFLRSKIKYLFDRRFTLGEDAIFNLNYIFDINKIVFIDNDIYNYNALSGGLTTKYNIYNINSIFTRYDLIFRYIDKIYDFELLKRLYKRMINEIKYVIRLLGIKTFYRYYDLSKELNKMSDLFIQYSKLLNIMKSNSILIYSIKRRYINISIILIKIYSIPFLLYNYLFKSK